MISRKASIADPVTNALATIARNLDVVIEEHSDFAREVQVIAQAIKAEKLLNQTSMTMHVSDQARRWQTKVEGASPTLVKCMFARSPKD